MNDLIKITNDISTCNREDVSKQVMGVCRAITPQFYKAMSVEDMRAEKLSIELLTADIDNEVLGEMCKRAVLNYPKSRSENPKTYFDINYILQFYKGAFNFIHCENVQLSKKAEKVSQYYDNVKGILYQGWRDDGVEKTVAVIQDEQRYSPKDFERMWGNLDDVDV